MPQKKKTPFSGKAKKLQLQQKKNSHHIPRYLADDDEPVVNKNIDSALLNIPVTAAGSNNRYALKLRQETAEDLAKRQHLARQPIQPIDDYSLETDSSTYFPDELSFPKRPPWNYNMSFDELEKRENRYFREYLNDLNTKFSLSNLSNFEENLETWRQLWRVLEMSDILILVVDIRFCNALFPPSIYKFVVEERKKDMVLLLNKIDLAPPSLVAAWMEFFRRNYPSLKISLFTSCPGYNLRGSSQGKTGLQIRRRKGRLRMSAEGAYKLQEICQEIVGDVLDLTSWKNKIKEEMNYEYSDKDVEVEIGKSEIHRDDTTFFNHEKYLNGTLTIGCVGQPNVGKSSVINGLMGKKVVSVSKSPGHTKHFQTIFLTNNVRLCDCPGLIFPSTVPKAIQVLMGSFPIAQLKEPYSSIMFLAERLDLVKLLSIHHPDNEKVWTTMDICDAWAIKRGFLTAKAARPDTYRAANSILRMALEGNIAMCLMPPGYIKDRERWEVSGEIENIKWVQSLIGYQPEELLSDISDEDDDKYALKMKRNANPQSPSSDEEFAPTTSRNMFDMLKLESDD